MKVLICLCLFVKQFKAGSEIKSQRNELKFNKVAAVVTLCKYILGAILSQSTCRGRSVFDWLFPVFPLRKKSTLRNVVYYEGKSNIYTLNVSEQLKDRNQSLPNSQKCLHSAVKSNIILPQNKAFSVLVAVEIIKLFDYKRHISLLLNDVQQHWIALFTIEVYAIALISSESHLFHLRKDLFFLSMKKGLELVQLGVPFRQQKYLSYNLLSFNAFHRYLMKN